MPFPNPRSLIVGYLNSLEDVLGAATSTRVPNPRPSSFVRVLHAGGEGQLNPAFEGVSLTVESWDDDEVAAETRAQLIRSKLSRATGWNGHMFYRYREAGPPVDLADESGQYRFTFTFSLRLRTTTA